MKKRSLFERLAGAPYVVWSVMFIVAPLLFVLYFAFTDRNGSFTLENILSLSAYSETFQEHIHHIRNIYDSSEYASSQLYRIDGLDVVYSAADGTPHTVIDRPAWLYLFYPNILLSCMFAGFGLIAIAGGILKNREVHTLSKKYSSSKKAKEKQSDILY